MWKLMVCSHAQEEGLDAHNNGMEADYLTNPGTGTPIGDPIEVQGIGSVFGAYRTPQEPLYV